MLWVNAGYMNAVVNSSHLSLQFLGLLLCPNPVLYNVHVVFFRRCTLWQFLCVHRNVIFLLHTHSHCIQSLEGANHEKAVDLLKGAQGTLTRNCSMHLCELVCQGFLQDFFVGVGREEMDVRWGWWRRYQTYHPQYSEPWGERWWWVSLVWLIDSIMCVRGQMAFWKHLSNTGVGLGIRGPWSPVYVHAHAHAYVPGYATLQQCVWIHVYYNIQEGNSIATYSVSAFPLMIENCNRLTVAAF